MVAHMGKLSGKVQLLVSNNRQHVTKTHRDTLTLAYWTILKLPDGSSDIAPNYAHEDVRQLVLETMPIIFLAAAFLTEFLNYPDENKAVLEMFNDFLETQVASLKLDELIANPPNLS